MLIHHDIGLIAWNTRVVRLFCVRLVILATCFANRIHFCYTNKWWIDADTVLVFWELTSNRLFRREFLGDRNKMSSLAGLFNIFSSFGMNVCAFTIHYSLIYLFARICFVNRLALWLRGIQRQSRRKKRIQINILRRQINNNENIWKLINRRNETIAFRVPTQFELTMRNVVVDRVLLTLFVMWYVCACPFDRLNNSGVDHMRYHAFIWLRFRLCWTRFSWLQHIFVRTNTYKPKTKSQALDQKWVSKLKRMPHYVVLFRSTHRPYQSNNNYPK